MSTLVYFISKDSSSVKIPDDYPFPESVLGRGRDFRWVHVRYMEYAVNVLDQGMLVHCNGDRCLCDPSKRGTHPQIPHLDMASSPHLTLVLLRAARISRGKLYSFLFLQRLRHLEGGWRAPAEPQKASGIEIQDVCRQTSVVVENVVYRIENRTLALLGSRSCTRTNGGCAIAVMIYYRFLQLIYDS
jgi:hypothetical protein